MHWIFLLHDSNTHKPVKKKDFQIWLSLLDGDRFRKVSWRGHMKSRGFDIDARMVKRRIAQV